uniref:Eukaryotic translation initiation factor 3 subunit A n=1 Tax=Crassostrea virginica TaxID=6565 RepID=A0A8B8EGL2_CRAVI|nr:eukaryotic translation initiation factor 3 subunit A-like isoform X2 [Crassostrea virginica]
MPTYFQRPENALKRANEFIDVGKKQRALDALYDVIKSKKHRTWQKIHEPIMEKYLQLCVELRKSHIAKEGLYQYKNICQQVNIKSLEDVVRKYINLAESKTEAARAESHQVVVDIDDLDNPDTPESLLLKAVSGEDTQDRTDRAILTPWVKFLWESYRQCLDLLRNNSRVERLYQDIAQQAFKFCLKYSRKTEFRKLCDNLRTHLGHIHKHQHQATAINLNNPDSQAMHLETRLEQLDSAIKMELWQEAFKAVEDIHGLIQLSKKSPKPSLMANYYQKLGMVFWKSGNGLFHASTLHRLYILSREQRKNLSPDELQKMASRVLCASLAVPIPASRNTIDQLLETDEATMEKKRRLATLLMLTTAPTRQTLIKELVKLNIIQYVHPEIQNLYNYLEMEFHPLKLYDSVKSSIEFISNNEELSQYIPALEEIIITRVLKQVSQVYQTIAFSRLADLIPFASKFRLERVIVDAAKTLELQVRIDHRSKSLSFGTDLMVAQKEDVPEGPYIQSMPSEGIRNQLISMARALHQSVVRIEPKEKKVQRHELQQQIANSYRMTAKKEHQRILQRRQIIEDRKEQLEHLNDQREREEQEQIEEQRKRAYDAEMARLEREAKERERLRKIEEHKEIQKKHAMERIEQLKKTDIGAKVLQNLDEEDFATLDVEDIMAKQVEQLEKEKKELMDRLKNQEKKIDHFARAKRLEEIPQLAKQYEEEKKVARDFFEQQEAEKIEQMKSDREMALTSRDRLKRMKSDKDEFLNMLRGQRKEMFKKKLAEFEAKISEERKRRLYERKEKRREERRQKWLQEKAEEEQRLRDEQLKREREEKEREEREKLEAEKREYEARLAKLEEQAEKQRQREREIEEKEAKRRQEVDKSSETPQVDRSKLGGAGRPGERPSWREREKEEDSGRDRAAWRPAGAREGGGGGGWREREKQRSDAWKKESSPTKRFEDEDKPRGESWRDRERAAPREDRPPARDLSPPSREPSSWGRGGDRGPSRDGGDRGGFGGGRREDRDFGRRDDRDFGRRDDFGKRDDRDFGRRDDRDRDFGRRDDRDRDFGRRDDRDFGRRDDRDFGRRGDDKDFGRRDDRDRDFGRRDDRDFGGRREDRDFDRRPPPREDRDFGDRRAPPREDRWRSDRDREGFSDRAPPREERDWGRGGGEERRGGDTWRDRRKEEGEERGGGGGGGGGGAWRGGRTGGDSWRERTAGGEREGWGGRRDDRGPARDEKRDDSRRGDAPPPSREGARSWRDKQPEKPGGVRKPEGEEDDGWTTVRY